MQQKVNSARALRRERDERLHRNILNDESARVATDVECQQIALLLNQRMVDIIPDPQARSWYKLFIHMDDDLSGKITFHELEDMIRNELRVSKDKLTNEQLKALWLALDEDKSGLITSGEFGHFMRKGLSVFEPPELFSEKVLRAKKARGLAARQEKVQRLQEVHDGRAADQAA